MTFFYHVYPLYMYVVELYIQWNIIQPQKKEGNPAIVTIWLEGIMLSEISWTEKDRYHMVSMWNLKK